MRDAVVGSKALPGALGSFEPCVSICQFDVDMCNRSLFFSRLHAHQTIVADF
jgi:hypothetical protein